MGTQAQNQNMKITAVAYGLAFLFPAFFARSLAEPEIGVLKSFATTNVQHVVVENAKVIENHHRLLQSDTCSNGLTGVENNGACCALECGTCGGLGCESRASSASLTANDCCISHILNSGVYCSSEGAAPCIIDEDDPTPALVASSSRVLAASSSPSDMQTLLDLHNEARCMHNADPLVYSEEVEATAQAYAEVLAADCGTFEHSEAEDRNYYGENLFMCRGTADCYTPQGAMSLFYDDEVQADDVLDYGGHATQILWKSTTELGCAVESCTLGDTPHVYLVCHYNPAGNVIGQYEEEVELPSGASC